MRSGPTPAPPSRAPSGRLRLVISAFIALGCSRSGEPAVAHRAAASTTYTNPVLDADFPDPAVIDGHDGFYYAYATQTITTAATVNIQVARSRDLVRWEMLADALPTKPAWASRTQKFWAPDVSAHDGKLFMYFSAEPDTRGGLCLAVATADRPSGPFVDSGKPLVCGDGFVNIDPMAFDDPKTHKRLLYWGSGFKPIKVRELAPSRLDFLPGSSPIDLLSPVDGPNYEKLVEGSYVIERDGTYYLFYSGDDCCGDHAHYAVMVARSSSALGPFEKMGQALGRPSSVLLGASDRWLAPGHDSILRDAAGNDWIFYHAIDRDHRLLRDNIPGDRDVRRIMLIDRLTYVDGWPKVDHDSPSSAPRPAPAAR